MITKIVIYVFPLYFIFGLRVQKDKTITECLEFFVPDKKGLLDFKIEFDRTFGLNLIYLISFFNRMRHSLFYVFGFLHTWLY